MVVYYVANLVCRQTPSSRNVDMGPYISINFASRIWQGLPLSIKNSKGRHRGLLTTSGWK